MCVLVFLEREATASFSRKRGRMLDSKRDQWATSAISEGSGEFGDSRYLSALARFSYPEPQGPIASQTVP